MRQSIDIPDAVFEVEVDTEVVDRNGWVCNYTVDITVGGVTVFTRSYDDDYEKSGYDDYADGADEARDKTLTAFGTKLLKLLEG